MFGWLRRLLVPKDPLPTRVVLEGDTVTVFAQDTAIESFRWSEVSMVSAYKQDCFAVDRIWMAFDLPGDAAPVCVHEECQGWDELVEQMQQRCAGYRADWWSTVAVPAFETNFTVIWKRAEEGQQGTGESPGAAAH